MLGCLRTAFLPLRPAGSLLFCSKATSAAGVGVLTVRAKRLCSLCLRELHANRQQQQSQLWQPGAAAPEAGALVALILALTGEAAGRSRVTGARVCLVPTQVVGAAYRCSVVGAGAAARTSRGASSSCAGIHGQAAARPAHPARRAAARRPSHPPRSGESPAVLGCPHCTCSCPTSHDGRRLRTVQP